MGFVTVGWPSVALAGQFALPNASKAIYTAPASRAIQVLNVYFAFNTTVTAGNRLVSILGKDSLGNILWRATLGTLQTASQNSLYSFQSAVSEVVNVSSRITTSLPPFATIPPGGTITVSDEYTTDITDAIGALAMTYTELV